MTTRGVVDEGDLLSRLQRVAALQRADVIDLCSMPGSASLTYAATLVPGNGKPVPIVVKVAPPGVAPVAHRDVLRQARLLQVLRDSFPQVPCVLFTDAGDPPGVPPLYAMERVAGETVEPILDEHKAMPTLARAAARMRAAAQTLGRLHAVVPARTTLRDEPVVGLADEVQRWARVLSTVPADLGGDWSQARERLLRHVPDGWPPSVTHGDFRLGNLVCEGDAVRAVIDWEIWTISDPRLDLAWLLLYSDSATLPIATREVRGLPTDAELVAAYEEVGGEPVGELGWFTALSCFKAASHLALVSKHNRRLSQPDPRISAWDPWGPRRLLARCLELLESSP